MSTINVEVVQIESIQPHPGADRLEVAKVLGTTCVVPKGEYAMGQKAYWFPPNILIPNSVSEELGVTKYLRTAVYPGDEAKTQCRVGAARLRGVPSYGFLIPYSKDDTAQVGETVNYRFQARKYEPPMEGGPTGDPAPDHPAFHRYTEIENYYRYPDAIPDGTHVRITEKIHGTNARFGLVNVNDIFDFMAGSNRRNLKPETASGKVPVYWRVFNDSIKEMLRAISKGQHNVVAFGEIFGPSIQDMEYGLKEPEVRFFDIAVDGKYLDGLELGKYLDQFQLPYVPVLYAGKFSKDILDQHTHGDTTIADSKSIRGFKGREGVVVTPLVEQYSDRLFGRLILKSISADYLARKGGTDN